MTVTVALLRSRIVRSTSLLLILIACVFLLQQKHLNAAHERETEVIAPRFRKELVVASLKGDDTSWLHTYLSDWKANVYVVNDQTAALTVELNKGREAMVYLR